MSAELLAASVLTSMPVPIERTQTGMGFPAAAEESMGQKKLSSNTMDSIIVESEVSSEGGGANSNSGSIIDITVEKAIALPADKEESKLHFFIQTCIPFTLAGFGMVAAGMLLDHWSSGLFLTNMPEAFVLIPALLGLKGNLEMTLASRLATMAHLGQIDSRAQKFRAFYSNLAADQAQAIVVSLFASLIAIGTQLLEGHNVEPNRALCLMLASTLTATVTSLVLASLMLTITFVARSLGLNPDNISTPIAAALGDLTSLASLVFFGTIIYPVRESLSSWLIALLALLLYSALFWMWLASRESNTRKVLRYGWFSVLAAMCLSTTGGAVLKNAIKQFEHLGLFQPLINGVGGNLVAVQSSKISTHLFRTTQYGALPANRLLTYMNPLRTFCCKERESINALILLGLALPGHLLFLGIILATKAGTMVESGLMNAPFVLLYLMAAMIQVALLLYFCQWLCRALWLCSFNPDINAIPLLTALGDLFGSILLAGAFALHASLK